MKIGHFLALGIGGIALWALLKPGQAHASTTTTPNGKKPNGTPATGADAHEVIDATSGVVVPNAGGVAVPAVKLDGSASGAAVNVSPGKITIPTVPVVVPSAIASQVAPVEPSQGTTVSPQIDLSQLTTTTPKDFDPNTGSADWLRQQQAAAAAAAAGKQVLGGDPKTWGPGNQPAASPASAVVIETPGVSVTADQVSGSAAATAAGVAEIAQAVIDAASSAAGAVVPSKASLPADSVSLAHSLLAEEGAKGWKRTHGAGSPLRVWQKARGLTVDGKFGPNSSAKLFEELGVTALVRYWPSSQTQAQALQAYAARITALGQATQQQAAASLVLGRERGQGYSFNPGPVEVLSWQP